MRILCLVLTSCLLGCSTPPDNLVLSEFGRSVRETVNDFQNQINQGISGDTAVSGLGGSLRGALDAVEKEFNE
jgi:hypothetical protein